MIAIGATPVLSAPARRWSVLALCTLQRVLWGLVLAMPIASACGQVVGAHPRGDALMFEPGGVWLMETARLAGPVVGAAVPTMGLVALIGVFAWLLPLGMLIRAVRPEPGRETLGELARASLGKLPSLTLLRGITMLLQALIMVGAVFAMSGFSSMASAEKLADGLRVSGPLLGVMLGWCLIVIEDAIRVPLVARQLKWFEAINQGWRTVRGRLLATFASALWRTLVVALAFAASFWLQWHFSGGESDVPALVLFAHLLAVVVLVLMRGEWLRWLARRMPAVLTVQLAEGAWPMPVPAEAPGARDR